MSAPFDRPTSEPGGCICDECGKVFIGAEWHSLCAICNVRRAASGKGAIVSDCGKFRYRLDRKIGEAGPVYAFFGINPSTADASMDDATVRKWNGFAQRWDASRYVVGNVFAFRSTDVRALATAADPIGRLNNDHIKQIIAEADILVPCWGDQTKVPSGLRMHFHWMRQVLEAAGKPIKTFGLSKGGFPKHPLMLGYDTPLVDWVDA